MRPCWRVYFKFVPGATSFLYRESKIDAGALIQCLRYKYCDPSRVFIFARPLFLSPCRRDGFRATGNLYRESKIDAGALIQCLRYKYCDPSRVFIYARPLFLSPCRRDGFRATGKTGSCSACVSAIAPCCSHIEGTLSCTRTFLYFPRSNSTRVPFSPPNI